MRSGARYASSIKSIEADELLVIPTVSDGPPTASFPPALLRETIDQVAFAAATDEHAGSTDANSNSAFDGYKHADCDSLPA